MIAIGFIVAIMGIAKDNRSLQTITAPGALGLAFETWIFSTATIPGSKP